MKKQSTQAIGQYGEATAEHYLTSKGYTLIQRNFNCRLGEIDLIMQDKNCIVFVEVRLRKHARYGSPLETITQAKQNKLRRTAQYFCLCHSIPSNQELRFDVIGIISGGDENSIEWIPNAF